MNELSPTTIAILIFVVAFLIYIVMTIVRGAKKSEEEKDIRRFARKQAPSDQDEEDW
jgi:hypothetical protein